MYTVLGSAINHPDAINPYYGVFNHRSLRSLADLGVDIDVVSPRPYAPPWGPYSTYADIPQTEDWGAYTVHHPRFWYLLPKRFFYGVSGESFASRVPKYVEKTFTPPDVVHACHIYPDGYGMLPYVRRHDLPLFVVAHGTLLNSFESQRRSVRAKIREALDAATGVLCVSDALSEIAGRLTDPSKVTTVPIGADPRKFPVDQQLRLRQELDISRNATVVLFVGRFSEAKGGGEIAELLPEIELENAVFVFVGTGGELKTELRRAVAKSRFPDKHVYDGLSPLALRRWYAVADLLLLPSHSEGRPTVIYEAMASETAVLGSTVGGVPEQVVDGETGMLVEPSDPDALEYALESLVRDGDRLQRMGEKGLQRLHEQGWTWADHADRVRRLHSEAIRGDVAPTLTSR